MTTLHGIALLPENQRRYFIYNNTGDIALPSLYRNRAKIRDLSYRSVAWNVCACQPPRIERAILFTESWIWPARVCLRCETLMDDHGLSPSDNDRVDLIPCPPELAALLI